MLARLAVDVNQQGRGIGEFLLLDVLRRAVIISEQTGLYAVVLDALNERARKFYLQYGFEELVDDPLHLFLPIETILKLGLIESSG
ncbi:MAG: GNAT family N-acetyltransferase [Blastocatellia bacterium]|nr:GNAT family N-acetyltransferase [Blastocatellia bacterium]